MLLKVKLYNNKSIISRLKVIDLYELSVTDDSKEVHREKPKERVSSGRKSRIGKCSYIKLVNIWDVC